MCLSLFWIQTVAFYVCLFFGQKVRRKSRVCVGFYIIFSKLSEIPTQNVAHILSIPTATACSSGLALASLWVSLWFFSFVFLFAGCCCWSLLYSSRADSLRSHVILHKWKAFRSAFLTIHRSGVQHWHGWCHMKLLPSRRVLCTPYNHAPCHFMQSHIRKVHAYLVVNCHPHFWQNDRGLLRATAVTRGWNGYRNKSQHRKLTLEKKILPPLLQGFEPTTFWSRARRSNHWAIPARYNKGSFGKWQVWRTHNWLRYKIHQIGY